MTCIGTFTETRDGFRGRLRTLTIDRMLAIIPAVPGENANSPDYLVMVEDGESTFNVGAGWLRVGDKAGEYIALRIEDPAFSRALRANLFASEDRTHRLVWSKSPQQNPDL